MKTSRMNMMAMWRTAMRRSWKAVTNGRGSLLLAAVCIAALAGGCSKSGTSSVPATPQTFASHDAAGKALYDAAKANDTNALLTIFGTNEKDIVLSGDPEQDKDNQARFVASYDLMHRWDKLKDGGYVLTIGASNYPLPFPLMKNSSGQWYFDGSDADKEIRARRVGENEIEAMDVLSAMAEQRPVLEGRRRRRRESARTARRESSGGRLRGQARRPVSRLLLPHPHQTGR
jgi:hypothetical protein